jgi:hypothetical protein
MAYKSVKKVPGKTITSDEQGKKARVTRRAKVTKKAKLISFLSKDRGADIGSLSKKLDWLPHTTRAALSKLRKSGYVITSVKSRSSKLSRYRITNLPDGQAA